MAGKVLPTIPIPEALRIDLEAFREATQLSPHYAVIVREALRRYIDGRIAAEPALRERFEAARDRLLGPKDALHLVNKTKA